MISIHALREEGDSQWLLRNTRSGKFLSTPSARRATTRPGKLPPSMPISIHALREEGDGSAGPRSGSRSISIHALREEGDVHWFAVPERPKYISIHALREEGDEGDNAKVKQWTDFYPRPPRGGRHKRELAYTAAWNISIHALREEGDWCNPCIYSPRLNFYPRPPRGGRRHSLRSPMRSKAFLSTPSARRATFLISRSRSGLVNFYPRPPRGGRPTVFRDSSTITKFLSTPSARRATCF